MKDLFLLITCLHLFSDCWGLLCYNCDNEPNNFLCVGEYNLRPCDSGFDTCQTIVSYSDVSETLSIIKTCTKNSSCQLQIREHENHVPCDQTGSSWICTSCCNEDACNLNGGPTSNLISSYLIFAVIFLTVKRLCA